MFGQRRKPENGRPTTQTSITAKDFWGIGLYGFANINSEENFYGATFLSLQIGKLRTQNE